MFSDFDWSEEAAAKALEAKFVKAKAHWSRHIFIWTSVRSKEGVGYGSYKYISKADLEGREYKVRLMDYAPSIEFTDVWFDPKTNTYTPRLVDEAIQQI
jgi:hypothetical protein